jgi:hypothetical protein
MGKNRLKLQIAALCVATGLAGTALAQPASVSSRPALGGNDYVNWASTGNEYDYLGASFGASSTHGLGLAVSGANASANGFERATQGSSWMGNFGEGDELLWTGFAQDEQVISIAFGRPVFGAGAQIQNDFPGDFRAWLKAYDAGDNLIYSDTFPGVSTLDGGNTAIFIGALDTVESISRLVFGVEGSGSLAINRLDILQTPSIPDAGGLGLLLVATLGGLHWWRRGAAVRS